MQFFTNIPVWVFPLFLGLLLIGLMSTRERSAPIAVFWMLPFLGLLSVRAVASLQVSGNIWILFALGYVLGCLIGQRAQRDYIIHLTPRSVRLHGEWLTLTTMMGLFGFNFAKGALNAVAPHLTQSPTFVNCFALACAIFAGIFLGRSLTVILRSKRDRQPVNVSEH